MLPEVQLFVLKPLFNFTDEDVEVNTLGKFSFQQEKILNILGSQTQEHLARGAFNIIINVFLLFFGFVNQKYIFAWAIFALTLSIPLFCRYLLDAPFLYPKLNYISGTLFLNKRLGIHWAKIGSQRFLLTPPEYIFLQHGGVYEAFYVGHHILCIYPIESYEKPKPEGE